MPVTADRPAPYATSNAILDIIERHRDRGLPTPVTGEVLARAGIAETLVARTLQSLHTLDLIDAETGTPTQTFEGLRLAPEAEFKQRLADWLRGTYADIFAYFDPAKDDEVDARDAFRNYKPVGQQGRMVALFMSLCMAAGLIPEKSATASKTAGRQRSAAPRAALRPAAAARKPVNARANHTLGDVTQSATATTSSLGSLPAPLAGLLASLPARGGGWPQATRDKFVSTFEAVLDFCFPIVADAPQTNGNGGQG
jgi:hypothetical protein